MNHTEASRSPGFGLAQIELLTATLVLGSALGTVSYFGIFGRAYAIGSAPQDFLDWTAIAVWLGFAVFSSSRIGRFGWALGAVISILPIFTPLGATGIAAWFVRAGCAVAWSGLVVLTVGRAASPQWRFVALGLFVLEVGTQVAALHMWDNASGRSTVMRGW